MTYDEIIDAWESERIGYELVMYHTAHKSAQEARRLSPYIGDVDASDLTRGEITKAIIDYSNTKLKTRQSKKPSKTTVYKTVKMAKQAFRWAHDTELVEKNPFRKIPMPPCGEPKRTFLDEAKSQDMLKAAMTYTLENMNEKHNQAVRNASCGIMVVLAIMTGMRRGELLALTWDDIDLDNKKIHVNNALKADGSLGKPKTKTSRRTISISGEMASMLRRYKAYQNALNLKGDWNGLFRKNDGTMESANVFEHWWRKWTNDNGFKNIVFHGLRHTHATLLIANGVDIKTVQTRLGHSSAMITLDVYSHALPSLDAAAAEELDEILSVAASTRESSDE